MPVSEDGVVGSITRAIKKKHPTAWVFKVHGSPYQEAGVPDLLVCVEGLLVGLEVKFIRPGESHQHAVERTTAHQRAQIARINRAEGLACTVTDKDEALDAIERAMVKHRERERRNDSRSDESGRDVHRPGGSVASPGRTTR